MKSTRANHESGLTHLFLILGIMIVLIGTLGYVFWSKISSEDSSLSFQALSAEELQECLRKFDEKNPPTPGLSDHRDKSECYPDIIAVERLTQAQKDEHERNSQIISDAIAKKDDSKCRSIKGIYYSPYPPSMEKVMVRTEGQAKKECQARVRSEVERSIKQAER